MADADSPDSDDSNQLPAAKKRKKEKTRAVFSQQEKEWLLNCIETHPKKAALLTTSSTEDAIAGREAVWKDIHKQFVVAGMAVNSWSWQQIAQWFKNSRRRAKTMHAKHKAATVRTGGGPKPKELPADISKVIEILGDSEKPMNNKNCSDAGFFVEDEVVDPDDFSRKKWNVFSTPQPLMPASARTLFPVKKVKTEAGNDFRKIEHDLIVNKLKVETRVLEKKEKLLDLKLSAATAGMRHNELRLSGMFQSPPANMWDGHSTCNPVMSDGLTPNPNDCPMSYLKL